MNIKCVKLFDDAIVPTNGSTEAAGFDLYAYIPEGGTIVEAGKSCEIQTGIAISPPELNFGTFNVKTVGLVFARSGLSTRHGLRPANCVGVCDYDYTGEYRVHLHNDSDTDKVVLNGERIAQVVFVPYVSGVMEIVDELEKTERGASGFGSTGK